MEKKIIKRTISFFVAFMLLCLVCGCASGNAEADTTDDETTAAVTTITPDCLPEPVPDGAEEAKKYADALVASLPERKFAKDSFSVAAAPGIDLAPADPADGYEDALIERNKTVENKYGVKVEQIETPADLMLSDAYSAYLSGTFYADALLIPQKSVGEFSQKGFLISAYSLPHIDYSKEYFDSDAMAQACGGYSAPVIAGCATKDIGSFYCIYVNTALVDDGELSDVCESVKKGDWTWDRLLEASRAAADINSGLKAVGAETSDILVNTVYMSGNQHYLDAGWGKIPAFAFETDLTEKAVSILRNLYNDGVIFDSYTESGSEPDEFRNGSILFHADTVGNMARVARMGGDWRLLPVPKLDPEQQTYYSYCSPDAPVMVVPAGNPNTEDAAYAIEALNAASCRYLDRCYYHRLVRTALNDSRTLDMLDYVCGINGGVGMYDFTSMYGSVFPQLAFNSSETIWELATKGGDLAAAAYNSRLDMNWRFVNAFPMPKDYLKGFA